jgi:drug/metabolite transporter (DMT)-like permease
MDWLERIKPGLPKNGLLMIAGLMWTGVGIFLISLAWEWIFIPAVENRWAYWIPGIFLAVLIYSFGFSRLARKNCQRIQSLPVDRPCLFAFQEWQSYPLVLFMIALGITLRKFTPLPKPLLGILYLGIGGGLGLASFLYYQEILKRFQKQDNTE